MTLGKSQAVRKENVIVFYCLAEEFIYLVNNVNTIDLTVNCGKLYCEDGHEEREGWGASRELIPHPPE